MGTNLAPCSSCNHCPTEHSNHKGGVTLKLTLISRFNYIVSVIRFREISKNYFETLLIVLSCCLFACNNRNYLTTLDETNHGRSKLNLWEILYFGHWLYKECGAMKIIWVFYTKWHARSRSLLKDTGINISRICHAQNYVGVSGLSEGRNKQGVPDSTLTLNKYRSLFSSI
jgi:hypothetical protein